MNELPANVFLDVQALLERSMPRGRPLRGMYLIGAFLFVVLASALISSQGPMAAEIMRVLSALAMIAIMGGLMFYGGFLARAQRNEQVQLEAIEELVTLRRWPQAAILLEALLSQPTRTQQARIQGLIYLAGVLARYHRFDDAIYVQNYLLENVNMDDTTAHALRLGRAMGMLREDHLFDADRAIAELRRRVGRDGGREVAADESNETGDAPLPQVNESAGLALIEIYRDVKTGHPNEALEMFKSKLPVLRRQLGHRVGDAWSLAAKAYDLLGRESEAQQAFENATLLAPLSEMVRRYPELASLGEKYRPARAPAEAA